MIHSISDLPEEITCLIISFLDLKRDLCELSLCSKSLQRITLPHLYRHVTIYSQYRSCSFWHLRHLTCFLLLNPHHGSLVRYLTIQAGSELRAPCNQHVQTVEEKEVIKKAIAAFSHSEKEAEEWFREASYLDNGDALLAIMLPVLVRLEKMKVPNMEGEKYFKRTIQRIVRNESPFDNQRALTFLTEVVHLPDFIGLERANMSPWYLSLFLGLPAVQAHQAWSVYSSEPRLAGSGKEFVTLPSGVSSLMHLELKISNLHHDDLRLILQSSIGLKTFIYKLGSLGLITNFQKSLEPTAKTLETLWLDYQCWVDGGSHQLGRWSIDFTPFTSLTFLHVSTAFLYGDPIASNPINGWISLRGIFPAQLEILEISSRVRDNPRILLYSLKDLLQEKQQGTELAKLKRLILLRGPNSLSTIFLWSSRLLSVVGAAEKANVGIKLDMQWYYSLG